LNTSSIGKRFGDGGGKDAADAIAEAVPTTAIPKVIQILNTPLIYSDIPEKPTLKQDSEPHSSGVGR
jgi:hypothetical protein